ncbi:MAG: DedA family protein [Stellaceae bacterium]
MAEFGGIEHLIHDYGYAAVAGGILLENFGLPLPGETLLIGGALAAAKGTLGITPLLIFAWAAAVVGNSVGWALGYYGGHKLVVRYGTRFGITAPRLVRVEAAFKRYGDYLIVLARFVVVLRQLSGIAAGTLEMGWWRFSVLNAVGAALWVGSWGLGVYFLGTRLLHFLHEAGGRIAPVLIAAAVIIAIAAALHFFWTKRG